MAVIEKNIAINMECTRYAFIFFPVATYEKIGDVSQLTILKIPVYRRIGGVSLFDVFSLPIYRRIDNSYQWFWFKPKERK